MVLYPQCTVLDKVREEEPKHKNIQCQNLEADASSPLIA